MFTMIRVIVLMTLGSFSAANPYISERFGFQQGFDQFHDFLSNPAPAAASDRGATKNLRTRANEALARTCHSVKPLGELYDDWYFEYCQKRNRDDAASLDSLRMFPSADVITQHAADWLRNHSTQPFFLWLHLMDPHAPYFPKAEALAAMGDADIDTSEAAYLNAFWNREGVAPGRLERVRDRVIKLYDAGIRSADDQIRKLTETLVELNVWDKCALAVTADHGEEFLDHGGRFHAPVKLTQELVHVPLLVRVPGQPASVIAEPFGLIDLAPTLVDVLDIPPPAEFRGQSWWGGIRKNRVRSRPVLTECVYGCTNPFRPSNRMGPRVLAVQSGQYKLVLNFSQGTELLFDLNADPAERNPLSLPHPAAKELFAAARRHLVESTKARDFDRREASLLRDLRLEWAHPAATLSH